MGIFLPKRPLDFQAETRGRSAVGSDAVDPRGHQQCCAFPSQSPATNNVRLSFLLPGTHNTRFTS